MPVPWGAIAGGVLSGLGGLMGGNAQRDAAREANKPRPFWEESSRMPLDPVNDRLTRMLPTLEQDWIRSRRHPGPPSGAYYRGPSSAMRGIVDAIRERAMNSTFIPQMQDRALEMATKPNPFMENVFNRAGSYRNPAMETMTSRGLGGGFGGNPLLRGILDDLLAGQERLGAEP